MPFRDIEEALCVSRSHRYAVSILVCEHFLLLENSLRRDNNASLPSSILLFVEDWLKKGFEDEDLSCSSRIRKFVVAVFESGGQELKAKAADIVNMIYNPDYVGFAVDPSCHCDAYWVCQVYLRQPRSIVWLRRKPARSPPEARPSDLAAALSAVAGGWFRRITYWDYVNFIRRRPTPRRIELLKSVYEKLTEWVQRSVMK